MNSLKSASGAVLTAVHTPPDGPVAVLVLHGGSADSTLPVPRFSPAALRLAPVAWALARGVPGVAVYRLRNSVRGWNGDGAAVLGDARWAVERILAARPGASIVVVGHSLGGRVAAHLAAEAPVVGAVGLAPWLEPGDPVSGLREVPIAIVQGGLDRMISTRSTEVWLSRAAEAGAPIRRAEVSRGGHAMLRYARRWHRLCVDGVCWVLEEARVAKSP
ncbi:MAG TPA: alpha/beta fold hydrolase [Nakamurella sp.]